jgi:hypothetical protein
MSGSEICTPDTMVELEDHGGEEEEDVSLEDDGEK